MGRYSVSRCTKLLQKPNKIWFYILLTEAGWIQMYFPLLKLIFVKKIYFPFTHNYAHYNGLMTLNLNKKYIDVCNWNVTKYRSFLQDGVMFRVSESVRFYPYWSADFTCWCPPAGQGRNANQHTLRSATGRWPLRRHCDQSEPHPGPAGEEARHRATHAPEPARDRTTDLRHVSNY